MTGQTDLWVRRTTIGCVALLALIAGTVSYLHMHTLVAIHGQPGWVAVLTPLSVDGMIVAASTTLLADSRSGQKGGVLPWALLVAGSVASLTANVAVAEPTLIGRVIAAWPSFALTVSYELLTRQVRRSAAQGDPRDGHSQRRHSAPRAAPPPRPQLSELAASLDPPYQRGDGAARGVDARRQAWQWAIANRAADGSLPSGSAIADRFGRKERWGRLVKTAGTAGEFTDAGSSDTEAGQPGWAAPVDADATLST